MENPRITEKEHWKSKNSQRMSFACLFKEDEDITQVKDFEWEIEPYWLSEAKVGDVFYYVASKLYEEKKWVKAEVVHMYGDVVFFKKTPMNFTPSDNDYEYTREVDNIDINSIANQMGYLYRDEYHTSKYDNKHIHLFCNCPYTKIVDEMFEETYYIKHEYLN